MGFDGACFLLGCAGCIAALVTFLFAFETVYRFMDFVCPRRVVQVYDEVEGDNYLLPVTNNERILQKIKGGIVYAQHTEKDDVCRFRVTSEMRFMDTPRQEFVVQPKNLRQ